MRKVVSGLFISLDGVTESPDQWQFDHFDEDMMTELGSQLAAQDAALLGRVTYEEWASYWPSATDEPYASHINGIPKHVVSTTLKEPLAWQNSTLISGNVADEITKLKAQPGKNIAIQGSPTLVEALLQDDLLDELILYVHPVVAGSGKRLFGDGRALKRLELVDVRKTATGVSILTYRPRGTETEVAAT